MGTSIRDALTAMPRRARRRIARLRHERGRMEDTYGTVELAELGFANPDFVHYQPSSWRHLDRALEGCQVGADDVFIDYGCGKGRVVYLAAQRPFGRVIGLEIAEDLIAVARRNIERNRDRLVCPNIDLVTADVVGYEVPDDVTYAYFYNPFVGEVFRAALDGLIDSLDRRPRELTVIYANPTMADLVRAAGRFELVREVAMSQKGGEPVPVNELLQVYRSVPG